MNHQIKKLINLGVVFVLILNLFFLKAVNAQTLTAGDLVKIPDNTAVYYIGENSKRYVYPHFSIYNTWYKDFSSVKTITLAELQTYPIGGNITVRPGTKLIKIQSDPSVYAVSSGSLLHKIDSEARAITLYGADWAKKVVDVNDAFFTDYTVSAPINSDQQPDGTLIKYDVLPNNKYLIINGKKRLFKDDATFTLNGFSVENIITTTLNYPDGDQIIDKESALAAPVNTLIQLPTEPVKKTEVAQIFVTTDHNQIAANAKAKAIIAVTLKDAKSQLVTDASDPVIFMSNNLGTLSSTSMAPTGGIAQVIFTAGQKIGTAEITVSLGSLNKTVTVDLVSEEIIQPGATILYDLSNISPLYKGSSGSGETYTLTWNKIADVDYYIMEESAMTNFGEVTKYDIPTSNCNSTICHTDLVHTNAGFNNIQFYYRVKAVRNTVEGFWNNTENGVTVDHIVTGTNT